MQLNQKGFVDRFTPVFHAGYRIVLYGVFALGMAHAALGQQPCSSPIVPGQDTTNCTPSPSATPASTVGPIAPVDQMQTTIPLSGTSPEANQSISVQGAASTQGSQTVQGSRMQGNPTNSALNVPNAPPPPPTDFQRLAEQTLGKPIPIFGTTLFTNPQTYAALTDSQATADYVVSTGDEVLVHVWGPVQIDSRLTVDRSGNIYIPRVGEVHVAGYRYQDLDTHIREAIGQVFHNVSIAVDLGRLRSIQIFVTGMAARPGTYVVSSLSTLINAVFATGGPAPMGSYRHIQLRRGATVVTDLDLYDLIIKGDKSKDARLLPGDVIFIPPVGPQVAIGGSVKNPAIFELSQTTTLKGALQLAGGTLNTADGASIKLERIVDHDHREASDVKLPSEEGIALKDGDVVVVRNISPRFDQTVTIRGNLLNPGRFAWHAGMKLSEIIPSKESLLTANFWQTRNVEGDPHSPVIPFSPPPPPKTVESTGAVQSQDATAVNHVNLPAPEINWSYAVIERTNLNSLRNELIPFNLGKLVLEHDPSEDRELQPGDVITIFSQDDIHVPINQQSRFVRLQGEIVNAGFYTIEPGDTLQTVLVRAGGVTPRAYLYATELVRVSEQQRQQQQLDMYIKKISQEDQKAATNLALNAGTNGTNIQSTLANMQSQLVLQLQTERASGRVALSIRPSATSPSDLPPMVLEDGDIVTVPNIRSTVNIIGSVYNPSMYLYAEDRNVKYYLEQAGGADRDSDPKHMFILRANGTVVSKQHEKDHFEKLHLLPGDALVVPAKLFALSKMKIFLDSLNAYGQLGVIAALAAKQ